MDTCAQCSGPREEERPDFPPKGLCPACYNTLLEERRARRASAPTCLYRLYDYFGVLLYVGISLDPKRRWKEHGTWAWWWPQVADKTVEWFDCEDDASDAERTAIHTELPRFNVGGYGEDMGWPAGPELPPGIPARPRMTEEAWEDPALAAAVALEQGIWRGWLRDAALNPEELAVLLAGRRRAGA